MGIELVNRQRGKGVLTAAKARPLESANREPKIQSRADSAETHQKTQ